MKVLVVTNMWPSPERPHWGAFVKSQADSLAAAGCENALLEIRGWRSPAEYWRALWEIPRVARECGAELVHAHYGTSGAAAMRVRLPLVVSFCGDDLLGRPVPSRGAGAGSPGSGSPHLTLKSRMLVPVSRLAARRAEGVIVKTEEMRRVIRDVPDVHVIPNGVDLARFVPEPREAARAALGWPAEGHVLLFAADRGEERKNWPLAEATRAALAARGLDVRLEAVHGRPQSDMVRAMNAADVLLLPSYHEGSPNVVKEAMALGLPVVAAPVGDCADLLRHVTPSAVVPRSVEAFTDAAAAALAAGRRSNGREVIERTLTVEAVAHRVLAVYRQAIERWQARPR
jgi:glycosyltransferase involved in cell wall biosynthesis